jgi:hypothetical protein
MSGMRRLAAILAVDVAVYLRLKGEDEAGTARAMRERSDPSSPSNGRRGCRRTEGDGRAQ